MPLTEGFKDKKVILAVLICVSAFIWLRGLWPKPHRENGLQPPALSLSQARKRTVYKDWRGSPFLIQKTSQPDSPGWDLGGIVYDSQDSYALINNEVVRAGDRIKGSRVLEIKADRVILNDGNKDFELKLNQ